MTVQIYIIAFSGFVDNIYDKYNRHLVIHKLIANSIFFLRIKVNYVLHE